MELEIVTLEITASLKNLSLPCPGTDKTEGERVEEIKLKQNLTSFFFPHLYDLSQLLSGSLSQNEDTFMNWYTRKTCPGFKASVFL